MMTEENYRRLATAIEQGGCVVHEGRRIHHLSELPPIETVVKDPETLHAELEKVKAERAKLAAKEQSIEDAIKQSQLPEPKKLASLKKPTKDEQGSNAPAAAQE